MFRFVPGRTWLQHRIFYLVLECWSRCLSAVSNAILASRVSPRALPIVKPTSDDLVQQKHVELLWNARPFRAMMMSDEQIRKLVDISEILIFEEGEAIIRQGEEGDCLFIMLAGESVCTVAEGSDIQEHRRYRQGDSFGERSLLSNVPRAATIIAAGRVEVLSISRKGFEMQLGPIDQLRGEEYMVDPRKKLSLFFGTGDGRGPRGSLDLHGWHGFTVGEETSWFAVYRPTSRDAIARMLRGEGVGKGFNVKGKSAKRGKLSGFVPFLQISKNEHKAEVEFSPSWARASVFYRSMAAREHVRKSLQNTLQTALLHIDNRSINDIDEFSPQAYGLDVPEPLIREVFITSANIEPSEVWQTGRDSSPAFMDMNLHTLRGDSLPKVVLMQEDVANPMNPCGLVMAYAEQTVTAVVSDFDTFTVGSRNMAYSPLPDEQLELAQWSLERTEELLQIPFKKGSWTSQWLELLTREINKGFYPNIPRYGFGDPTSYRITEDIIAATVGSGAVRHGPECFNFMFPQELDNQFMVVWDGFEETQWKYLTEPELRVFLIDRVKEGFAFPINPVWPVRDPGWYEVYEALREAATSDADIESTTINSWYPEDSEIIDNIERLQRNYPQGFTSQRSSQQSADLDRQETRDLGLYQVDQVRQKLIEAIRHGTSKLCLDVNGSLMRVVPVAVLKILGPCNRVLVQIWDGDSDAPRISHQLPGRKLRDGETAEEALEKYITDKFGLTLSQIEVFHEETVIRSRQSQSFSMMSQYTRRIFHIRLLDHGDIYRRQLCFDKDEDLLYEDGSEWTEFPYKDASFSMQMEPALDGDGVTDCATGSRVFAVRAGDVEDRVSLYSWMDLQDFEKADAFSESNCLAPKRRRSRATTSHATVSLPFFSDSDHDLGSSSTEETSDHAEKSTPGRAQPDLSHGGSFSMPTNIICTRSMSTHSESPGLRSVGSRKVTIRRSETSQSAVSPLIRKRRRSATTHAIGRIGSDKSLSGKK